MLEGAVVRPVQCVTVSGLISKNRISKIDLLKVDVEGDELEVLKGVKDSDWGKIEQVVLEVHDEPGRLNAIRRLLSSQGFAVCVEQDDELAYLGNYMCYAYRS